MIASLSENTLYGNKKITKLTISNSVTEIKQGACAKCKNLGDITINANKIETIEKGAFDNIKKGATITVIAKNKKVYNNFVKMFKKSTNVKKLKFKMKKGN